MDALYLAILLAFFVLISALAYGCAQLQARTGAPRPAGADAPRGSAPVSPRGMP